MWRWRNDLNQRRRATFDESATAPSNMVRREMEVAQHGFAGLPRHRWDNPEDPGRGY